MDNVSISIIPHEQEENIAPRIRYDQPRADAVALAFALAFALLSSIPAGNLLFWPPQPTRLSPAAISFTIAT
jgi:hypothetical protein